MKDLMKKFNMTLAVACGVDLSWHYDHNNFSMVVLILATTSHICLVFLCLVIRRSVTSHWYHATVMAIVHWNPTWYWALELDERHYCRAVMSI
jgi:hypothetical protein